MRSRSQTITRQAYFADLHLPMTLKAVFVTLEASAEIGLNALLSVFRSRTQLRAVPMADDAVQGRLPARPSRAVVLNRLSQYSLYRTHGFDCD